MTNITAVGINIIYRLKLNLMHIKTTIASMNKYLGTLVVGNVVDIYSTQGCYNRISIWTVPFAMAIVFLAGFLPLSREDVKFKWHATSYLIPNKLAFT